MSGGRVARCGSPLTAALLLCVLGLASGCEDEPFVSPEDQQFVLSTPETSWCPSLNTPVPHTATVPVIGTVFAADGQVAVGVPVAYSVSPVGSFEQDVVPTNETGQAVAKLSVPRPEGDEQNRVTVTATLENGLTRKVQLWVPYPPTVTYTPASSRLTIGAECLINVVITGACAVRRIEGSFSWNSNVLEAVSADCEDGTLYEQYVALNDPVADNNTGNTNVKCSVTRDFPSPGRSTLTFSYERGDVPFPDDTIYHVEGAHGTNQPGPYIGFRLRAASPGTAGLALESTTLVFPSLEPSGLGEPYATTVDGRSQVAIGNVIVKEPA